MPYESNPNDYFPDNSHFRAALQKTLNMHRQRHKEYTDVIQRLTEYRSHVDQRRRDHGYESEHG